MPARRYPCLKKVFKPLVGITFEGSPEDYDTIPETDNTHGISAIHFRHNCISISGLCTGHQLSCP
jgi:hypothetical protein